MLEALNQLPDDFAGSIPIDSDGYAAHTEPLTEKRKPGSEPMFDFGFEARYGLRALIEQNPCFARY